MAAGRNARGVRVRRRPRGVIEREARRDAFSKVLAAIDAWCREDLSEALVTGWASERRIRTYVDCLRSRILNLYTAKR